MRSLSVGHEYLGGGHGVTEALSGDPTNQHRTLAARRAWATVSLVQNA
jgi:hypothetical protein